MLRPYDATWPLLAAEQVQRIAEATNLPRKRIQHVGSTSVQDLPAKPILDIDVGILEGEDIEAVVSALVTLGFIDRGDHDGGIGRLLVWETAPEVRSVHVHIIRFGSSSWTQDLMFRDALRQDGGLRARYAKLKVELASRYASSRADYRHGKGPFIVAVLNDLGAGGRLSQLKGATEPGGWIFFDLGWTLVDETEAHLARFARLRPLSSRYSAISDQDFLRLCEHCASAFARSPFWSAVESLDPGPISRARKETTYDHALEQLYAGVVEVLERLGRFYHLGLIANQSSGTSERLAAFEIRDAFSVVVSSTEVGFSKPDPRIFEHAELLASCDPTSATMVGDRLDNDIAPANARGWSTIRVLQGFSRCQVARSITETPDRTVESIGALDAALDARA